MALIMFVHYAVVSAVAGTGEQKLCATVFFSAALLNIALNVALVPPHGMKGAASATALSLITAASLNALVLWRRLGIKMPIWNNLPKL